MNRWSKDAYLRYCSPTPKIVFFGVVSLLISMLLQVVEIAIICVERQLRIDLKVELSGSIHTFMFVGILCFIVAILEFIFRSDNRSIKYCVRKQLCLLCYGNPLHLKDGDIEPLIKVRKSRGGYVITIECWSVRFDDLRTLETTINGSLRKKYRNYAVIAKEEDIAGKFVNYYTENVVENFNKQSVYYSLSDVPEHITKVFIREDIYIDYARVLNGSAIVAGRSRSGKTTAIISTFLLPTLKQGRDDYDSRIVIIDPKTAELSTCSYVLSPKTDGSVEHILNAIRDFDSTRIKRQKIINEYSQKNGKAVKWYEIGMKRSLLFIDEFVAISDMFPKKSTKENPDYSLADFQGILRRLATQGASAGCFLILSVAEASVGTGGIESAVNNACGIRILFKPSMNEARFLWSSESLEVMRERHYSPGDAWFSADDGNNNCVRFVKFPRVDFGEYEALSELLDLYYENDKAHSAMSEAKERCAVSRTMDDNAV